MVTSTHTLLIDGLDLTEFDAFQLAGAAGCFMPDNLESEGASFLTGVRDAVVEALEFQLSGGSSVVEARDAVAEDLTDTIDATVPVYTHAVWRTFVDLGAYQVSDDLAAEGHSFGAERDLTSLASAALFHIANHLGCVLLDDLMIPEDDDEQDDADDAQTIRHDA